MPPPMSCRPRRLPGHPGLPTPTPVSTCPGRLLLALLFFFGLARETPAGDVEGTVALPELRTRTKTANDRRYPGTAPSGGERTRGPALVFLEGDGLPPAGTPPAERPKMEQRNRQFLPLLLPVTVGTTVEFPNYDNEFHNVFSRSDAKEIELGRYGKGEHREVTFDKPGLVRLRCEVHSAMHAAIVVLATPVWAVTDKAGRFTLKGVPAGRYRVYAFHEDARAGADAEDPLHVFAREVEVPAEGSVSVDFDLRNRE